MKPRENGGETKHAAEYLKLLFVKFVYPSIPDRERDNFALNFRMAFREMNQAA